MTQADRQAGDGPGQETTAGHATSLNRSVMRSATATYGGQLLRLTLQFLAVAVLARLLTPADFGVFAMIMPIYAMFILVVDFGLSQAAVQRTELTRPQMDALFWINVAIAVILSTLLFICAPLIGSFYADPRAGDLARFIALPLFISACSSQHVALLSRQMRFGLIAGLDTLGYVLGVVVAFTIAAVLHTVWALAGQMLTTTVITALGGWICTRYRPKLPGIPAGLNELIALGSRIAAFNVLNSVVRNLDNVLIGRVYGDAAVGLYDRAYKLLLFPLLQINEPLVRMALPTLARLRSDPSRYRMVFLQGFGVLLLVTQPGIVWATTNPDALIEGLLGDKWAAAAPIFRWLGLAALQGSVGTASVCLFVSQERGQALFYYGAFAAVTSTASFVIGLPWGPIGVAAAYSLSQVLLRGPVMWWLASRKGPVSGRDLTRAVAPHLLAMITSAISIMSAQRLLRLDPLGILAVTLPLSYAVALATLAALPSGRSVLRHVLALFARASG